jgi:hypothetical protein
MKTTTIPLKHSVNLVPFRLALLLIPLALGWELHLTGFPQGQP